MHLGDCILNLGPQCESIREFDQLVTVPMFGYGSVEDYYAEASCFSGVSRIAVPLLSISAADDPFIPEDSKRT